MLRRIATLSLVLPLAACVGDIAAPTVQPPPSTPPVVRPTPTPTPEPSTPSVVDVPVTVGDPHGGVLRPPDPPVPAEPRARRRMDLDQLDAAIRGVSGGIGWVEMRGNTEVNLFVDLAATLGRPDFIQRTEEDLIPTAMFQKFLDDAARSVCTELMRRDPDRDAGARTFFVDAEPADTLSSNPQGVEQNLRGLLLRFHGQRIPAGDARLEPWTWFFRRAEHTGIAPEATWRALCVALITHPDFYMY